MNKAFIRELPLSGLQLRVTKKVWGKEGIIHKDDTKELKVEQDEPTLQERKDVKDDQCDPTISVRESVVICAIIRFYLTFSAQTIMFHSSMILGP